MGFTSSVRSLFLRCLDFRGRSSRAEFWYAILFSVLLGFATAIVDQVLGKEILNPLCSLALSLPMLSLQVRRLHDANHSGWWLAAAPGTGMLVLLVFAVMGASVGWAFLTIWVIAAGIVSITLLVWYCDASHPEANSYGPFPFEKHPMPLRPSARFE